MDYPEAARAYGVVETARVADATPLLTRFSELLKEAHSAAITTLEIQGSMMDRIWGPRPTEGASIDKESPDPAQAEVLSALLVDLRNLLREIRDNAAWINSAF